MGIFESIQMREETIGVVGLGYVGLPLAVHLAAHYNVVGFDLKADRITELKSGYDRTLEVDLEDLTEVAINYTNNPEDLAACLLIIVAVPTPIDAYNIPDLGPLKRASTTVGKQLQKGACVVFESTVFPGATEEVCVPLIERESGLKLGQDFTVGYSPERINPGDKVHTLDSIVKVVAGSDAETTTFIKKIYGQVVHAGVHCVSSIKVAEAAKVIENTQRDLNIALMNELAMIFDKMGLNTVEILNAADTKWNFLHFRPGLVGGHCIGVDPYYLTSKAESLGFHPEMIIAGRRINDSMGKFIAERTVKLLIQQGRAVKGCKVALLGITFKEDVPDIRNTRVVDIVFELEDYGIEVLVNDPIADTREAYANYGVNMVEWDHLVGIDAVVLAVAHKAYREMALEYIASLCDTQPPIVVDVKSLFDISEADEKGIVLWQL